MKEGNSEKKFGRPLLRIFQLKFINLSRNIQGLNSFEKYEIYKKPTFTARNI